MAASLLHPSSRRAGKLLACDDDAIKPDGMKSFRFPVARLHRRKKYIDCQRHCLMTRLTRQIEWTAQREFWWNQLASKHPCEREQRKHMVSAKMGVHSLNQVMWKIIWGGGCCSYTFFFINCPVDAKPFLIRRAPIRADGREQCLKENGSQQPCNVVQRSK